LPAAGAERRPAYLSARCRQNGIGAPPPLTVKAKQHAAADSHNGRRLGEHVWL